MSFFFLQNERYNCCLIILIVNVLIVSIDATLLVIIVSSHLLLCSLTQQMVRSTFYASPKCVCQIKANWIVIELGWVTSNRRIHSEILTTKGVEFSIIILWFLIKIAFPIRTQHDTWRRVQKKMCRHFEWKKKAIIKVYSI